MKLVGFLFYNNVMQINYGKCGIGAIKLNLTSIGKCSECKEDAVIELKYAKKKLCSKCFSDFFVRRVRRTVEEFKMFKATDRIAVALSGGKDSVALLHSLKLAFPETEIHAFYINLGIKYYSDHLQEKVIKLCENLKVPLEIYNLMEEEEYTIDDFLMTKYKSKMCSVCGTIKRNIFTKLSIKVGANILATGHNLDDTVSTMMSAFMNGDFESIRRLKPVIPPLLPGHPKKVKPLVTTPEIEDLYYVYLNKLPVQECNCPHGEITPIKGVKSLIDKLEEEQPDVKFRLFSVFRRQLIPLIEKNSIQKEEITITSCKICGMPSSSEICAKCRRVNELKEIKEKKHNIDIEVLSIEELGSNVILLDVRTKEEHIISSLPNSINIPQDEISTRWKELKPYRKTHKILVFCNSGRKSYSVALKLRNLGFKAYNLKNGLSSIQNTLT